VADEEETESTESMPADDPATADEMTDNLESTNGSDPTAPTNGSSKRGHRPDGESTGPSHESNGEPSNESDARVPEPVGVGSAREGGRVESTGATEPSPAGKTSSAKTEKKGRATAKRDAGATNPHRTGPVTFVKESIAELRKVVYPTGPQLMNYFIVVLIFVLFVIAYVSLLDLGLGALVFRIFA